MQDYKILDDVEYKIRLLKDIYIYNDIDDVEFRIDKGDIIDYIQRERVQKGNWIGFKEAIIIDKIEYDVCFEEGDFEYVN